MGLLIRRSNPDAKGEGSVMDENVSVPSGAATGSAEGSTAAIPSSATPPPSTAESAAPAATQPQSEAQPKATDVATTAVAADAAAKPVTPAKPVAAGPADPDAKPAPPKAPVPSKAPPAPKAPPVMEATPWQGPLVDAMQTLLGSDLHRAATFRNQDFVEVTAERVPDLLLFLRDDFGYAYLVEETAVDNPTHERRFELVYILYNFDTNHRCRVKARLADGAAMQSVTSLYAGANWMEREIYDMFGIPFEGHPDLRRILMPEDWNGHPFRKDYEVHNQDIEWVHENLHIESAQ